MAHKANCLEVGMRAVNVGRNTVMTVMYDEIARLVHLQIVCKVTL